MTNPAVKAPWRVPMAPRDRDEVHRAATPLELLFDDDVPYRPLTHRPAEAPVPDAAG